MGALPSGPSGTRLESDPSVFLSSRHTVAVPFLALLVASAIFALIGWGRAAETCLALICAFALAWVARMGGAIFALKNFVEVDGTVLRTRRGPYTKELELSEIAEVEFEQPVTGRRPELEWPAPSWMAVRIRRVGQRWKHTRTTIVIMTYDTKRTRPLIRELEANGIKSNHP
ncbi:hypothetical protein [Allobranchiibius sp. CTAmp26]|uniref:hypothetical protein n=1 Tax=Allobranchiibius sp. CTAmp26 TaxID=2815214 RepID=UPI001AA0EAFC|nr:hypothetical protein [Allobranchiibius sp. CTAmp26]MBO1756882.1 hypothetical protein [Allobranchiibius sp. CTAmp26]